MPKICELCGKKRSTGNKVSHSHIATRRVFNANLQKVRVQVKPGDVRRMLVCTSCIRSGQVKKPGAHA